MHPIDKFFSVLVLAAIVASMPAGAENKTGKAQPDMPKDLVKKGDKTLPLPIKKGKFMFSVTLHKREEIDSLLTRADSLSKTMRSKGNKSVIALILHGPEIKLFTSKNYKNNKDIVDKAARLDGDKVIEVKVCKTKMKELGIKDGDLPSFVEIIPYAPDEEEKLLKQGYVYL